MTRTPCCHCAGTDDAQLCAQGQCRWEWENEYDRRAGRPYFDTLQPRSVVISQCCQGGNVPIEHLVLNSPPMPDYPGHPPGENRSNCPMCMQKV